MNVRQRIPSVVRKQVRAVRGYASGMICKRPRHHRFFVLLSGGRRGSNLLIDLLNSHTDLSVDGEILNPHAVPQMLAPRLYLRGCRMRSRCDCYGFKVSVRQLKLQRLEPAAFLRKVIRDGGCIVHLDRTNALRSAISREIAHARGRHVETTANPLQGQSFHIDSNQLVDSVCLRISGRRAETELLKNVPHLSLNYEHDLLWAESHQCTCDRVFRYLDCEIQSVSTTHAKRSPPDLSKVVSNYDEVVMAVRRAGLGQFLNDDEYRNSPASAA
ncbi:MAG: hypothetical protein GY758_13190 [Fuerstiella sp.]|nr:hypothetical protein [Fuerstiella sp.]MCP4509745.1 hypothetical protein [Fuerstiella sp.]